MNYSMQYAAHKIIDSLDWSARVAEWNIAAGTPQVLEGKQLDLVKTLLNEEILELACAVTKKDRIGIADAIGDAIFVLLGIAYRLNMDMAPVMTAIVESNNTKFLEGIYEREDGKIGKGPAFVPPKIEEALHKGRHMGRIGG